jgi:3-hydroxypropanoate dehydrogenase
MKWGPTWSNTLPLRIVYVTSPSGRPRLIPHLQPGNVGKASQAPVNAILALDSAFHHQIPRLFPFRAGMRDALEANPGLRDKIGTGGAWMQAAYFIIAFAWYDTQRLVPIGAGNDCRFSRWNRTLFQP